MPKRHQKDTAAKPGSALGFVANQGRPVQWALFFALFFGFVWVSVDPRLIYHGGGEIPFFPTFRWGADFFHEFWRQPGGLAQYLSAFLSQFLYLAWSGALVLTLQAWLIALCADAIIRGLGGARLRSVCFAAPLLLLALHSGYTYCFSVATSLLVGLGWGCVHLRWSPARAGLRLALVLVYATALYAVAGPAFLVFIALAAAIELHRGCGLMALGCVVWAGLAPIVGGGAVFGLGPAEAWRDLLSLAWKVDANPGRGLPLVSGLYLLVPAVSLGLVLWREAGPRLRRLTAPILNFKRGESLSRGKPKTDARAKLRSVQPSARTAAPDRAAVGGAGRLGWLIETCAVLLAAGAVMAWGPDQSVKAVLSVDYYASDRRWPQVLEAASGNPTNIYVLSAVNRALYYTGRLGYDLPLFQRPDDLLLLGRDLRAHWSRVDLYLDLGCVNAALHHLSEALAVYGERPALLRRLALIHLVLGNVGTARIYLHSLARTPFHASWAGDYLRRLAQDPTLAQDPDIVRLRRLAPVADELIPLPATALLEGLLDAHRDNRMACEYLVAHCLLSKDLRPLARDPRRLEALGSSPLPPLYDEALVLMARQAAIDPATLVPAPSPAAVQRYERFAEAVRTFGQDPARWSEPLAREFAGSYFLHYLSPR